MVKTIKITGMVPQGIFEQVSLMAADNTKDLSMSGVGQENPLYNIHQAILVLEIGTHLSAIGRQGVAKPSLLVAVDEESPSTVLGFLLSMPIDNRPDECGISYGAVKATHRRKGIFKALVMELGQHFPKSTLSCPMSLVPMYERMGYKVTGHRDHHIAMSNGASPGGTMPIFNPDDISDHPVLLMAQADTVKKFGQAGIFSALQKLTLEAELATKKAKMFAEDRLKQTQP